MPQPSGKFPANTSNCIHPESFALRARFLANTFSLCIKSFAMSTPVDVCRMPHGPPVEVILSFTLTVVDSCSAAFFVCMWVCDQALPPSGTSRGISVRPASGAPAT